MDDHEPDEWTEGDRLHDARKEQDLIDEADLLRLYPKGQATRPEHLRELGPGGRPAYHGPVVPHAKLGVPCGAEVRLTSAAGNGPLVVGTCYLDKHHDVRHFPPGGNMPDSRIEEPTEHAATVRWS